MDVNFVFVIRVLAFTVDVWNFQEAGDGHGSDPFEWDMKMLAWYAPSKKSFCHFEKSGKPVAARAVLAARAMG